MGADDNGSHLMMAPSGIDDDGGEAGMRVTELRVALSELRAARHVGKVCLCMEHGA